jgi:predicted tellurium resistance membrane protein TerC
LIEFFTAFLIPENLLALATLSALEIVLGIDNIVFIAILTERAKKEHRQFIRRLGLFLAMFMRVGLLFAISWVISLTQPMFSVLEHPFSGRDLILIGGGLFLIAKATFEVFGMVEGEHGPEGSGSGASSTMGAILAQIVVLDIVFSLDSVITAVGMAQNISIMVTAVLISVGVMMIFATPISEFILKHPSVKMLALSFLILIGVVLLADGFGNHINKGYVYFAMVYALGVEALNFWFRKRRAKVVQIGPEIPKH